jgi:CRP-like cAMP-binding protein
MESLEIILARHPFFDGLNKAHLELLTGCTSNSRFNRGDYLFREEEDATQFFIIRHGKVSIEAAVPDRGTVTIQTYEAGDVVGWSWLFPPYRWHFSGRAIEMTHALVLDGKCLRGKCEQDPVLGYEFMKRFSHKIVRALDLTRLQLLELQH